MKSVNRKIAILFSVLLVIMAGFWAVYLIAQPDVAPGSKSISVTVTAEEGTTELFSLRTDQEYLGDALREVEMIEGEDGAFGMYITAVNGIEADSEKQQWWCITKEGGDVFTGVDETPIQDGDTFELTLMTGY